MPRCSWTIWGGGGGRIKALLGTAMLKSYSRGKCVVNVATVSARAKGNHPLYIHSSPLIFKDGCTLAMDVSSFRQFGAASELIRAMRRLPKGSIALAGIDTGVAANVSTALCIPVHRVIQLCAPQLASGKRGKAEHTHRL